MTSRPHGLYASRPRLFLALVVGVVAAFAIPLRDADAVMHALIGWNVAVYLYLIIIWLLMLRTDHQDVRAYAKKQDEKAYVILLVLSLGALMSLVAIVIELAGADTGESRSFHIAMTAATVIGSWLLLPTVFGLHYAHVYYQASGGEATLIFPDKGVKPDYWDFMYFSFTIAVAFATSDIAVCTRGMRRLVLAQSVLAFFFNASILALSINISASLIAN